MDNINGIIFFLFMLTGCNAKTITTEAGRDIQIACKYNTSLEKVHIYKWYRIYNDRNQSHISQDGVKYSGTTSETLTIKNTDGSDNGDYICKYYTNITGQGIWGTRYKLTVNVNGMWSDWYQWNQCTVSCGGGIRSRTRLCNNPTPSGTGDYCEGSPSERSDCETDTCPVDGQWSDWSGWDRCPVTCGGGRLQRRTRQCNKPAPAYGGKNCKGKSDERTECGKTPCPVDGNWSDWSDWGLCSVSCGGGTRYRYRWCSNPSPSGGGKDCEGSDTDSRLCETQECPGWEAWTPWRSCDTTCGEGYERRERNCIYRKKVDDNSLCWWGSSFMSRSCHITPCQGKVGRTLNITCRKKHYFWYKDNKRIDNKVSMYTLHKDNLKYSDDGKYKCGRNRNETEIIIKGRPTITTVKRKYYANRGSYQRIQCVSGYSNPAITALWWTKVDINGKTTNIQDILISGKYNGGTLGTPDLIINRVDDTDDGEYRCHANNSYGITIATTRVIVGDVPIVIVPQKSYVSKVDESVTLQCTVQNGSTIYWKKGKYRLYSRNGKYSRTNVQNSSLTISNIETRDSGTYSCIAISSYGEVSEKTELKVIYTQARTTKYDKTANTTVVLRCIVNDFDKITWWHNNISLQIQDDHKYSIITNKESELTINNLTRHDRGFYVCESSFHDVSSRSDSITLYVKDIPFIQPSHTTVDVIVGNDVLLPCVYDAYPEATEMYWKKDGDALVEDFIKYNGSSLLRPNLTIIMSEFVDSGIYICVVRNSIGSGFSGNIQLIITEPQSTFSVGHVAGAITSVLVVVVVVIVVFLIKRKRQAPKERNKRNGTGVSLTEPYVNVRQSDRQMNRESRNTAADSGFIIQSPSVQINKDDSVTYYNMSDITTKIKVDDLKNYIATRQTEDLTQQYKKVPYGAQHSTTHAQLKNNMPKNRFKAIFPYDHSRVALEQIKGKANSDYINASFVDGFDKQKCYIACQGPIKTTIEDYWRMIWQENVRNIVMLTNLIEGEKVKCERYWPKGGKTIMVGHLQLVLTVENERAAYMKREISVVNTKNQQKRNIIQYHFTAWPDHGTPDPLYLVSFHKHVISESNTTETGPLLVHCSAGIGRTGTYIALDALLAEGSNTGYIDIFEFLKKMRYCRMNMIQTADQYVCLHLALLEAFTMRDKSIKKECFSKFWHENKDKLHDEFKMLEVQKSEHGTEDYTAALSSANISKNRSRTVLALDSKRMFLVSFGKGRSDYINAVHVPSYTRFVGYITTQLPLADTKIDFWTLIKDHDISTVILLIEDTSEIDMVYSQSDSFSCGPFNIKIKKRKIHENDITEATLLMSRKNDREKQVVLFQLVCKGPPKPADMCRLVDMISTRVSMSNDPVVVVSSDGAKNCGLFCALINAVSSIQIDKRVDMFQIARLLQLQQPEFFMDINEYRLYYEAVNYYIDTSNVYANI